jgi:hypothetical protein
MSAAWPCLRLSVTHRRRRPDESSSLARRSSSRVTLLRCHLPPRAVGIPRSFNSRAMALMETKPAFLSLRIVGPKASARTSATRLLASPDVSWPRRVSTRTTVVRCHLPPTAPGIPLRFNSFAIPRWETKPAAISSRIVGSKARARASAARLPPNAPCLSRLPGEVSPRTGSIGPSWPGFDTAADVKIMSRRGPVSPARADRRGVAINHITDCNLGPSIHRKPALRFTWEPATSVTGRAYEASPSHH